MSADSRPQLQNPHPRLVLASASVTRRRLLEQAGLLPLVQPAAVDEATLKESARAEGLSAEEAALMLAECKAQRITDLDALVIGADQILTCEGRWFDKPADVEEARQHLLALRGRTHALVTAMVCQRGGRTVWHHVATPRLAMRSFSDDFLDAYLAAEGAAILSSVGAYRLEAVGVHLFDQIEGSHDAILGLPLLPLLGFLRQHGLILA